MRIDETQDESLLWRPPPPLPYVPGNAVLKLPRQALAITLSTFSAYGHRRLEACAFWYGVEEPGGSASVRAVVIPRQRNSWGHYAVHPDAISMVSAATRPKRWTNLAQVHTHPGPGVEHSRYDDAHANSRHALSLVFPFYGAWSAQWPDGVGIHEFQAEYWHLLAPPHARCRLVLTDLPAELVDTRP